MGHPSPCQDDRVDHDDHVEIMAKQVQIGEALLTELFEQEDRGETPDWERLRGLPGKRKIKVNFKLPMPHPRPPLLPTSSSQSESLSPPFF
jgi:hypothetical protein